MKNLDYIIYVDDEPDIRTVAKIALEREGGFSIDTAGSAKEAFGLLRERKPDLLLLDVMMPVIDGPTMLAGLRVDDDLRDIPVVFMTAKVQPQEIETYRAMGVVDVVAKPFDPFALSGQLRAIWEQYQKGSGEAG